MGMTRHSAWRVPRNDGDVLAFVRDGFLEASLFFTRAVAGCGLVSETPRVGVACHRGCYGWQGGLRRVGLTGV
jgi:hypothetical protein